MRGRFAFALAHALAAILAAAPLATAQAPASGGAADSAQLVEQLAEGCRAWLMPPASGLKSLRYTYHLGGKERIVELAPGTEGVRRAMWQGATLSTGLHALVAAP